MSLCFKKPTSSRTQRQGNLSFRYLFQQLTRTQPLYPLYVVCVCVYVCGVCVCVYVCGVCMRVCMWCVYMRVCMWCVYACMYVVCVCVYVCGVCVCVYVCGSGVTGTV